MMPLHLFKSRTQRHQPVNSVPVRSTERGSLLIAEPSAGAGLQSLAGLADIPFALLLTGWLAGGLADRHGPPAADHRSLTDRARFLLMAFVGLYGWPFRLLDDLLAGHHSVWLGMASSRR